MIREAAFRLKTAATGRSSIRAYRDFLTADALSAEAIEELSRRRSAAHARFAFAHSPFYRELYSAHGFTAADLRDDEAFSALPFVDKQMLRDNLTAIRTDEANARNTSAPARRTRTNWRHWPRGCGTGYRCPWTRTTRWRR